MKKNNIKFYLSILNINSINQLDENDLDYWHQKKFIEIQRSSREKELVSKQLIELNIAKDYLDEISLETLKKQFYSSKENIYSKDEDIDEDTYEDLDEVHIYKNNKKNYPKSKRIFIELLNFFMIKDPKNIWKLILFFSGLINLVVALASSAIIYAIFAHLMFIFIIAIISKKKNLPYID